MLQANLSMYVRQLGASVGHLLGARHARLQWAGRERGHKNRDKPPNENLSYPCHQRATDFG
jgi:hypothetical protein